MKTPGFSAEKTLGFEAHYGWSLGGKTSHRMPRIVPQLWRDENEWKCDSTGKNCAWVVTQNWYDDPGGWGVPPWIGDTSGRQCMARCGRIKNPAARAECRAEC